MTAPSQKAANADELIYATGESTLGIFLVASSGRGVRALFVGDRAETLVAELRVAQPDAELIPGLGYGYYEEIVAKVRTLIERPTAPFALDLTLDIEGGDFNALTRAALDGLSPGQTATPEDIVRMIGAAPQAASFVRAAAANNLIAVALPFHRLEEPDGTAPYYRWGEARRRALLYRERGGPPRRLYGPVPGPGLG